MIRNAIIIGVFGTFCLFGALLMSFKVEKPLESYMAPPTILFGPIETKKPNQVVNITFSQVVPLESWSSIEVDVENENGDYLFGFGDELWHESGWDSDGYWEESKTAYDMDITFLDPGRYFLNITVQGKTDLQTSRNLRVTAKQTRGSSLLFIWAGFIAFVIAALMIWMRQAMKEFDK